MWSEFIHRLCTYADFHRGKSGTHEVNKCVHSSKTLFYRSEVARRKSSLLEEKLHSLLVEKEMNDLEHYLKKKCSFYP